MNTKDEMNIGELEKLANKRDEAEDMLTMSLDLLKREVDKRSKSMWVNSMGLKR